MKFHKVLALLLAGLLAVSMLSACGNNSDNNSDSENSGTSQPSNSPEDSSSPDNGGSASFSHVKIAFATNNTNEDFIAMQNYFNNVLGPALNVEFMYSEALKDAGALTTFIENAYAAGCQGVITDLAQAMDQGAAVANDLGMFYVGTSSGDAADNRNLEYYISVVGASAEGYGESYAEAIKSVVDDGGEHSVIILSGAAAYGATSAIEGTAGSLRALQDVFGLKYDQDVNVLATSETQTEATNDKGIKITIVPGMADLTALVSPLLQTGEYDVVVGTTDIYGSLSVTVDEVEKATGKNISFISRNPLSETVSVAFNSSDSTGHPVMDAMVAQGMYERIAAVLVLRNCIDGYAEQMKNGAECSRIAGMRPLVVTSADQFNTLASSDLPYCFTTTDEILAMCSLNNPDVTYADIDAFGAGLTAANILDKFS